MSIRRFAGVLAGLVLLTPFATAAAPPCIPSNGLNEAEKRLEERLGKPVSFSFEETPLNEIIHALRDVKGINIHVDRPALQAEGISLESPISIKLEQVSLKSALNLILHDVHLTWRIKNEVLEITTEDLARQKVVAVTYQVADILSHKPVVVHMGGANKDEVFHFPTADRLIKFITSTVAPRSWSEMGGVGEINYTPKTRSLVITQTNDNQEQIADLLAAVRRLQEGPAR